MKAMVFAAGLGSRLHPMTHTLPKALVEVDGEPMISWVLQRLQQAGVSRVVVNAFHKADLLIQYLSNCHFQGMEIAISDERPDLLDTGGGLEKAQSVFTGEDPILLHNVDVISDLPLKKFFKNHLNTGAMVSLAVQERPSTRKLLFDDADRLVGWEDTRARIKRWVKDPVKECHALSFSGIHVVSKDLFSHMPPPGKFSIIDFYLDLAAAFPVVSYRHDEGFWTDIGKPCDLESLNSYLRTPQGIQWKRTYLNLSSKR